MADSTATTIDTLQLEIRANSSSAYREIENLAGSLERLTRASASLRTVANRLTSLNTALSGLRTSSRGFTGLTTLSTALNNINTVSSPTGLRATVNALRQIPTVVAQLDTNTLNTFADTMTRLSAILDPVATRLSQIGVGIREMNTALNRTNISRVNRDLQNMGTRATESARGVSLLQRAWNFGKFMIIARYLTRWATQSVSAINEYIENMNLFSVSMGEFYGEAKEYAEMLQNKMGIDSSEWMRGQGVFMAMASGFGMAREQAYQLSKGMTELSYDMSSLYNIPIEEALTKMRSALAGEIEPLRHLGISLTEATLQELALEKGITKKVNAMTESEKAQLRYIAIVESAKRIGTVIDGEEVKLIGDFARTLDSPANAIRVLKQQITQLARAIGSVFLPIITQVMPYVQAFVRVLTSAISKLAVLVGFEMSNWGNDAWEGVSSGVSDTTDALDNATASAKEYKKSLQGFDELNILSSQKDNGSGGASIGSGGDLGLPIESVWTQSMLDEISSKSDEVIAKFQAIGQAIKDAFGTETIEEFIKVLGSIGVGLLAGKGFLALGGIAGIVDKLETALLTVWVWFDKVKLALTSLGGASSSALLPIIGVVVGVASVVYVLWQNFDKVVAIGKQFIENIGLKEKFEGIKEALSPLLKAVAGLGDLFTFIGTIILAGLQPAIAIIVGAFNGFISAIEPIIMMVTGIIQIIGALGSFLVGIFTGDLNKCSEAVKTMFIGIVNTFFGGIATVLNLVDGFVRGVIEWFTTLWDVLVGHSIVPDMVIAIVGWFGTMVTNVINAVKTFATNIINKFKEIWSSITNWYRTNVAPKFTASYWADKFSGFVSGFKQSIKNMLNAGIDMINKFIGWLNSKLRFSWDGLTLFGKQIYPSGSVQLVTIPQITQRFEDGGFIEDGLFTMNKGEIAGKFTNGKSVVANNEQIIAGISQGVYEAMIKANGKDNTINLNATFNVDGKELGKSFVKYHNGVVQQTGLSPLLV